MFVVNDDLSIYATRGDIVCLNVSAMDDSTGNPYEFQPGDIVRMKIFGKKDAETVYLSKDFPVVAKTNSVGVMLTEQDTKIGDVISKPTDYWYEIELNPYTNPQTIVGYDEDGAKIFKLFPEGKDLVDEPTDPEVVAVVDTDLDLTSSRPVENKAIARAVTLLKNDLETVDARLTGKIKENKNANKELNEALIVERTRIDNLLSGATADGSEVVDIRVGADGVTYESAGTAVRENDYRLEAMKERKYGYFQAVDIEPVENVVYNMVSKTTLEIDGGWYCECDVSDFSIVLVNCSAWSQYNLFAGGAFYDADGNLIKCFKNTEDGNFTDVEVFVPSGAVTMVVNGKRGYDIKVSSFVPLSLYDDITAIKNMPVTTNHWYGKKVVWLGTSVPFGANATKSYADELSKKLNFELVNCSMPGLATHMNADGTMLPYGSLCMSKEEYAKQGMNIPESPLPYVPGGSCNNYYRTYENIFTEENADADLYVFDVVPNNTNFSTEDWDAFNAWNWRYKDGSSFADHRSTFLGAVLFLMDKMYSLNPNARMVFLLGSEFVYDKGKTAFALIKDKWNIPVIDVWGKVNTSPKSLLVLRSENGTDSHPSTYAHEIMGNMLVGEFLGIS